MQVTVVCVCVCFETDGGRFIENVPFVKGGMCVYVSVRETSLFLICAFFLKNQHASS